MFQGIILVAVGSGLGASFRFLVNELAVFITKSENYFLATISVNIIGSFLAGMLHFFAITYAEMVPLQVRLLLMAGFLGGFTTFSSFSLDILRFVNDGQIGYAIIYGILSVILSLLAVFCGFYATKMFF